MSGHPGTMNVKPVIDIDYAAGRITSDHADSAGQHARRRGPRDSEGNPMPKCR